MGLDWSPFVREVHEHKRFLLTTHVRPDGDGLGSMLALGEALGGLGKEVRLVIASSMPPRYQFLDPRQQIERFNNAIVTSANPEVIIVLDTGTWNQLGDLGPYLRSFGGKRIVIDHHQTQDELGGTRLVDASAEATGRLVAEAVGALGADLSAGAAQALFVALAMDTGWFHHENTTAATLGLCGELVRKGADPHALYERLFEQNSLPRLKLLGLVLDRLELSHEGRVACSEIRQADYPATGAVPPDSEDMVNFPRSLTGVEVGALFMEQPRGGVKVSFRSRGPVDVARLAEKLGGGGHRAASGATVPGTLPEARARVLELIATALHDVPAALG
jgi:phosphoesterase RecJ-like protein